MKPTSISRTCTLAAISFVLCAAAALHAAPDVTSVSPAAGSHDAARDAVVQAGFTMPVQGAQSANFTVSGSMRGKLDGVYSGDGTAAFSFDPTDIAGNAQHLFPGEIVDATLTTGISDGTTLAASYSWRFRAAAGAGPGVYDVKRVVTGNLVSQTTGAVMADLDGDGDLDLFYTNVQSTEEWYLNDGSGAMTDMTGISPAGSGSGSYASHYSVVAGDVNEDGFIDLACSSNGQAFILLNAADTANPAFAAQAKAGLGGTAKAVALADMNGDGHLDLICGGTHNSNSSKVILGNGSGSYAIVDGPSVVPFGSGRPDNQSLDIADFNADGLLDILAGNYLGGGAGSGLGAGRQDGIYFNNGGAMPSFQALSPIGNAATVTRCILSGDTDGDGDVDVVAAFGYDYGASGSHICAYLNNNSAFNDDTVLGAADIIWVDTVAASVGHAVYDIDLADSDGDGDLDVFAARDTIVADNNGSNERDARVYFNDGLSPPSFPSVHSIYGHYGGGASAIATGDLDGDGDLDIAFGTNSSTSTNRVNTLAFNSSAATERLLNITENDASGVAVNNGDAPANGRDFGDLDIAAGPSNPLTIHVKNTGYSRVTLGTPVLSSTEHFTFFSGMWFPVYLDRDESAQIILHFDPASVGAKTATVSFTHDAYNTASPFTFELGGTGTDAVISTNPIMEVFEGGLSGAAIGLGSTASGGREFDQRTIGGGATASLTIAINNSGTADLIVGPPVLSGDAGDFVLDVSAMLASIPSGQATTFTLAFEPTSIGMRHATVSFTHNAPNVPAGPFTFGISGEGVTAPLPMAVDTVSPTSGPVAGGTLVTLAGSGLSAVTEVRFGGVAGIALDILDAATVRVLTPAALAAGRVEVAVFGAGAPILLPGAFLYMAEQNDAAVGNERKPAPASGGGCAMSAGDGAQTPVWLLLAIIAVIAANALIGPRQKMRA